MVKHAASVTVGAPVGQVFELFSHFSDFPKFMSHVKEVTYIDAERSHWIVDILGLREWDAVNENWIPGRRIGWRSTRGIANAGTVLFEPDGPERTCVHVEVEYDPPGVGDALDLLGGGGEFERRLQRELDHFAQMVHAAPPGALDPNSSSYLFHDDSAVAKGEATDAAAKTLEDATIGRK